MVDFKKGTYDPSSKGYAVMWSHFGPLATATTTGCSILQSQAENSKKIPLAILDSLNYMACLMTLISHFTTIV